MTKFLDSTGLSYFWEKIKAWIPFLSRKTQSIPFGQVDSTSTSTVFTATVDGITELSDGVCCYLRNGVVTSASGFTLNINGLGAKRVYGTMASATALTTQFNINYTMLFVYNSSRVTGGCWDMYVGYTPNVGHLKTDNSSALTPSASESFTGDISLHKVAKTGAYSDLSGTPTIPDISGKVDKSSQSIANDTAHANTYDTTQGKKVTIGITSGTANVDVVPHSLVTGTITETVATDKTKIPTAAASQQYSKKLQNQILSRGENLVINCNGYMGDNTNFTSTTFTAEVCNGSYGSFYKAGKTSLSSSYNIPINPSYKYRVCADVKRSLNVSGSDFYVFLGFKDVDNNSIMQGFVLYVNGTETELTQDLVDGDTVVHVADLSGWNTTSGQYNIMFFNWTNTKGYTYPPYTYTRRYKGYGSNNNIDFENNTITLSSAYTGETIPSGTKIAKQRGGIGTYFYAKSSSTTTDWKRVEGYYNAYKQNDESCIPFAAAKASMNFLVGYGNSSTSEGTWITNMEVTALASIKDLDAKLDVESPMLYDGKEIVQDLGSKYALRTAYIDYRGIWQGSSTYKHYAISVVGIRKVEITPQQDSVIFYSFLKNYVSGTVPSCQYAYGYTSRCQSDGKIQLLVPYDADTLYIYVGASSTQPYKPASLKLTGIAITETEDEGEYLNCNPTTADETFVSNWRHHDVTSMILSSPYSYIRDGYIRTSDSKYVDSTVNKSSWIIVSENISKIHVKTSSNVTYIAFLSKEGVSNTVLPFYVEDTSLITVQANSETTYNVPSGTAYIYIYLGSLTNNVYSNIPQSLYFTGDKGVDMFPLTVGDVSYDGSEPVSLTGIALDEYVVHKTGAETIAGLKRFTNAVTTVDAPFSLETNDQAKHSVSFTLDNFFDDGGDGIAVLSLDDSSGEGNVIIRSVASPINLYDAVNKDYLLSLISNATKYYFFLFRNYQIGSHEIGNTGIDIQSLPFAGNELNHGRYKVTLLRHIWYDGMNISGDSDISVLVYFQKNGSTTKTYISGGTYIMRMITSPNDQRNRMGSVVVNLVGFITLAEAPALNDTICIQIDGHEGLVLGGEQPISGSSVENVDDNDFVLFEKINMTGIL